MNKTIPRYERANERITICVPQQLKDLWDYLNREQGVRVSQITREFLMETLPKIAEQVKKGA